MEAPEPPSPRARERSLLGDSQELGLPPQVMDSQTNDVSMTLEGLSGSQGGANASQQLSQLLGLHLTSLFGLPPPPSSLHPPDAGLFAQPDSFQHAFAQSAAGVFPSSSAAPMAILAPVHPPGLGSVYVNSSRPPPVGPAMPAADASKQAYKHPSLSKPEHKHSKANRRGPMDEMR